MTTLDATFENPTTPIVTSQDATSQPDIADQTDGNTIAATPEIPDVTTIAASMLVGETTSHSSDKVTTESGITSMRSTSGNRVSSYRTGRFSSLF